MDDPRYFARRALDYAAAARETTDSWYAQRFVELARHFADMARRAPRDAKEAQSPA